MSCPICQKPSEKQYRPFCSKRCADVDLGRWFNGSYTIPTEDPVTEDDLVATQGQDPDIRH